MPLVAAAIMPHGFALIPELSEDAEGGVETRRSMQDVGRRFASAGVEVVVLAGPHGTRVEGAMCVMDVGRAAGSLSLGDRTIEMNVPCDRRLIKSILDGARESGISIAAAGFGGNRADQSVAPLDWGAVTPLWFVGHDANRPRSGNVLAAVPESDSGPPVVLITPSRSLRRRTMVEFGTMLAKIFAEDERKIGFIASCDWGHTHREDGPYGAHPKAAEVDAKVVQAVKEHDLHVLAELSEADVADAAIDGLWQTLILAGIQDGTPCDAEFLSYEVPTYFGMIVSAYAPVVSGNG